MSDEKFILDATAGFRLMWFNKKHPNTIYLDNRAECEPDIIGDFRDLKEFSNETFNLVVFDPPHLIKKQSPKQSNIERGFGVLSPETWQNDLKKGFAECWRVLKPYGILLFKWSTVSRNTTELLSLFPSSPLFYNIVDRQEYDGDYSNKRIHRKRTLWFCFMKIPKTNTEGQVA